jgi:hypothetical protein
VKLDDKWYKLVDQMELLTAAPPSLMHARSLTVKVGGSRGKEGAPVPPGRGGAEVSCCEQLYHPA